MNMMFEKRRRERDTNLKKTQLNFMPLCLRMG